MAKRNFDDTRSIIHYDTEAQLSKKVHMDVGAERDQMEVDLPLRLRSEEPIVAASSAAWDSISLPIVGIDQGKNASIAPSSSQAPNVTIYWADFPPGALHDDEDAYFACVERGECDVHHPTGDGEVLRATTGVWDDRLQKVENLEDDSSGYHGIEDEELVHEDHDEPLWDEHEIWIHEGRTVELQHLEIELDELHEAQDEWVERCLDLESELDEDSEVSVEHESEDGSDDTSRSSELELITSQRDSAISKERGLAPHELRASAKAHCSTRGIEPAQQARSRARAAAQRPR